ncbi:MAG: SH3 domain-containing protein [Planctomycetota bacterium]|jgi:hypothetical protein
MKSRTILSIIILISFFIIAGFCENVFAQEDAPGVDTSGAKALPFPYIAEITGNDIYVRSGPGTNYYFCSKLNKGDKITVVSSKFSWSCILPPKGSFSLISKRYVNPDPVDPNIGIVKGDNVRVWAGSKHRKVMQSGHLQVKLDKDHKVRFAGKTEEEEYYKIDPPPGAYLYVSTRFTKPVSPVIKETRPEETAPPTITDIPTTTEPVEETAEEPVIKSPSVVPTKISVESEKLAKYYELERRIQAERKKPIEQQDYTKIKEEIVKIAGNADAGKAAKYSEFGAKRIERFELALRAAKELAIHQAELQKKTEKIEKAKAAKYAKLPDTGRFAVIGTFQTSSIYSTGADLNRYRIVDEFGKIVCYAYPTSSMDLSTYVDTKVGLIGKIEPFPQAVSALVRFSEIVELK